VSTSAPPRQLLLDQPLPSGGDDAAPDFRPGAAVRVLNRGT
jgi:hypothetical protein